MTDYADSEDILIGQEKIEKVTKFKYIEQTTHLKDTTKEEVYAKIRSAWSCFGEEKGNTSRQTTPHITQKQVMDQSVLLTMTYGRQTWSLTKQLTKFNKLKTAQSNGEEKC